MTVPNDTKDPIHGFAPDKIKDSRPAGGASETKDEKSGSDVGHIISKVVKGELDLDSAIAMSPGIVTAMHKTIGNDAVAKLMGADKKDKEDAAAGKEGKKLGGAAGKGAAMGKAEKEGAKHGAAIGGALGGAVAGVGGAMLGGVGGFVLGGMAGKMLDSVKGKAAKDADDTKAGKDPDGKDDGAAKGTDGKAAAAGAAKDGKDVKVVKGQDPAAGVKDAIKIQAGKGLGGIVGAAIGAGKMAAQAGKDAGQKAAQQAESKKTDDTLNNAIADKNDLKGGGQANNSALAVQDAAATVASNKDDGKGVGAADTATKDGGDGKVAEPGKGAAAGAGKVAGKAGADGAKVGAAAGADAKGGAADGKAAEGKDGKAAEGKDGKAAEGKDGKDAAKEDPSKQAAKDEDDAKKSPIAKDAQKAKDEAGKDGGAGGKGGPGGEGKEGGAAGKEGGGGGAGAAGKAGLEGAGGAGGAGAAGGDVGGGGAGGAGGAPTVKGTLDEYLKAHPDPEAEKRVTDKGYANDKLARDANVLNSNIAVPPEKSWTDAISPKQEWFAFKKGVLGKNKWSGQDAALDFMTRLNAALDSIGGAASKIGLAATIGGAILTLLVPPVGAFLLSVGRVCNAISLVCSAMRIVTSIIQTVMLAVKVAKEKDPIKRLEMMQEMKANVQAGVMAGLDVIMSKLGGKGGGGAAKSVGGKSLEAAKAAFKEGFKSGGKGAMGVVKGVIKGSVAFVKVGASTAFQGIKQAGKDAISSIKGQLSSMKQLGLKGTLKVAGQGIVNTVKSMGAGLKDALKEKFVKPFTDLRSAWKSCGNFRQNWADFRAMIAANGGGFSGYKKTIGQLNFPSWSKAGNWKEKVGAVFSDMTNTSKGGYASQVMAGIEGTESKHKYRQKTDGSFVLDKNGNKILDKAQYRKGGVFQGAGSTSAGGTFAADQMEKLNKLKKIAESGSDMQKRKALNGDSISSGALEDAANKKTGMGSDALKQRHQNYKDNLGGQYGGMAYVVPGHMPQSYLVKTNLDWHLEQKIKKMEDSFKLVNPSWGSMAWGGATGAYAVSQGKAEWGDVARGAVSNTGQFGEWGAKTFGEYSDTKQSADKASAKESKEKWGDWSQLKLGGGYNGGTSSVGGTVMNTISAAGKKGLEEAGKKADENREAAVKAYGQSYQAKTEAGVTAGKVGAATAPALALVQAREAAIKASMSATGPKTASAPASVGGGLGAAAATVGAAGAAGAMAGMGGGAAQAKAEPPPAPPAPPEGTVVPSLDLLPRIDSERKKLDAIKKGVEADIKTSEEIKIQAIGADAQMQKYASGLDQQATEIGAQKAEAVKDATEIAKSKEDISAGGKKVGEKKTAAEGEKTKTEAKASEGKGVQNPQVDEAKKKAEEDKKAADEKAAWDREYAAAGTIKRGWMNTKKFIGGVLSWVAKAAKWVWEKVIKVAIEAVKKAVAKVLGFITDLMMKGIMSLVKCFLSKEEGARLDATFAEMKKVEAEQAKKGTEEAGAKNTEAKMKLSDAQQAAKAKIDHAQGNIETGKGLLAQADANKAALDQEEADVKAKNDAFKAQYTPYFDWVAKYESEQGAGGGGAGAGAGAAAAGAAGAGLGAALSAGASQAKDGMGGAGGAGAVAGAVAGAGPAAPKTAPANEGAKEGEGKQEHPADKKLDSAIAAALQNAVNVVILDSRLAQGQVGQAAQQKGSKVSAIASKVGDQNAATIKAAGKDGDQSQIGKLLADEAQKTAASAKASSNVSSGVVGAHSKAEQERQSRLAALASKAAGLAGLSLAEGLAQAQALAKELAKEAKAIDESRNEAMMELDKGYNKALGG